MPQPPHDKTDGIPLYTLYGEETVDDNTSLIHIESIAERSQLYQWEIDSHAHQGTLQTLIMFSGGAEVHLDDLTIDSPSPRVIVIPPATVHAFKFEPNTHGYVLTISESILLDTPSRRGRAPFDSLFLEPSAITLRNDSGLLKTLEDLLVHLLAEFQAPKRGHRSLTEWLAKSVLILIEREQATLLMDHRAKGGRTRLFTEFRALVEQHYLEHWKVEEYAQALNVTPSKLTRISKALTGHSAFEITQQRLLLEARRRLVHIVAPVQLLAYELGFEDPAYFNRFFKKRTGMTPAHFRRAQQEKLG
jgi:AraC family transcriptional activator of pobA